MTRLFLLALLSACLCGPLWANEYHAPGWSTAFYENCPLPRPEAISWATHDGARQVRFMLSPGDQGGCRSDAERRNGAKFWERAELRQKGTLARGRTHEITFRVTLARGMNGTEESFFQIHGWSSDCPSPPLMMLMLDRGRMQAKVLQRQSDPTRTGTARITKGAQADGINDYRLRRQLTLDAMLGKPLTMRVLFDWTGRAPRVSMSLNGTTVVKPMTIFMASCATPHIKIGLYRRYARRNDTSIAYFRDITIQSQ